MFIMFRWNNGNKDNTTRYLKNVPLFWYNFMKH